MIQSPGAISRESSQKIFFIFQHVNAGYGKTFPQLLQGYAEVLCAQGKQVVYDFRLSAVQEFQVSAKEILQGFFISVYTEPGEVIPQRDLSLRARQGIFHGIAFKLKFAQQGMLQGYFGDKIFTVVRFLTILFLDTSMEKQDSPRSTADSTGPKCITVPTIRIVSTPIAEGT